MSGGKPAAPGGGGAAARRRQPAPMPTVYCVIPRDLAPKLHDLLREHFAGDPLVQVVVERREGERRAAERRKAANATKRGKPRAKERRKVRAARGRRVEDRRARAIPTKPPELPRKARRYEDRLEFVVRREATVEKVFEAESARLVMRFQKGEKEAYGELYLRYFGEVFSYARMALKDRHEAEDVTQTVFTNALERLDRYERRRQPFRAWLFTIARNAVVDVLRRRKRIEPHDPEEVDRLREGPSPETDAMLAWLTDSDVSVFVSQLPDAQREQIVLRYLLDLPTERIAAMMSRSPGAVRKLQERALHTLKDKLEEAGLGPREGKSRRTSMLIRLKPAPVLAARRFALWRDPRRW